MTDPRLRTESKSHAYQHSVRYKAHLLKIATELARHENSEVVLMRHIDEAHYTLVRSGLARSAWYAKRELQIGVGCLIFGLGPAVSSVAYQFVAGAGDLARNSNFWWFVVAVPIVMLLTGLGLALSGWMRG